jgi:hypothetical protein
MIVKEILESLVDDRNPVLVGINKESAEASVFLNSLSDSMLKKKAHLQDGLYIAEINDGGYLGTVLFRFK